MELKRKDVAKLIMFIRKQIDENDELKSVVSVDCDDEESDLIYGNSNEYLSDFMETITGLPVRVIGEVEELYACPCCGYKTLTEVYNLKEGTGYDICPLCGWEDDRTTDVDAYRSINRGSIAEYRKKLFMQNITNKWLKEN